MTHLVDIDTEDDPFDFKLFALWALRDAFETTHPEGSNPTTAIRLAAKWIGHAGDAIRVASVQGRSFPERMGFPGDKYADRGWTGFNEERRAIWREGFQAAAEGQAGVDDDARNVARKAVEVMT